MAKVLLIQPHNDRRKARTMKKPPIPLTLIYLGTAIEDKHQVKIYDRDLNLNDSEFISFLKDYNPDIIGFTFMTSEMIFDVIYLGKLIKEIIESVIVVVPAFTFAPPPLLPAELLVIVTPVRLKELPEYIAPPIFVGALLPSNVEVAFTVTVPLV